MKKSHITPIDVTEVVAYFAECGIKNEKVATLWYHEQNAIGWMIGKNKIVNWRSAASVYIMRIIESNPQSIVENAPVKQRQDVFQTDEMQEMLKRYEEK